MSEEKYFPDKKKIHKLRTDLGYKNREAFAAAIEAYVTTLPPSPDRIKWISARTIEDAESGKAATPSGPWPSSSRSAGGISSTPTTPTTRRR